MKSLPKSVLLFTAIWLLVLLVPPLRRQPWIQWQPSLQRIFQMDLGALYDYDGRPDTIPKTGVLGDWYGVKYPTREYGFRYYSKDLLEVIKRHPDQNFLRANYLRFALGIAVLDGPPTEPGDKTREIKTKWITPADLVGCLEVAREGELHEPNNIYFPFVQAYINYYLGRMPAYEAALARAGRCTTFQIYETQNLNERLQAIRADKHFLWEERWAIRASQHIPFGNEFLILSRWEIARGMADMRNGKTSEAFKKFENVINIGRIMRTDPHEPESLFVGEKIEANVWLAAPQYKLAYVPFPQSQYPGKASTYKQELARDYANFCRQYNHSDMGAKSVADADEFLSRKIAPHFKELLYPASVATVRISGQGAWLAGWLARFTWIFAATWLISSALSRAQNSSSSKRAATAISVFSGTAVLVILTGALYFEAGNNVLQALNSNSGTTILNTQFFANVSAVVVIALPLLLWWLASRIMQHFQKSPKPPHENLGQGQKPRLGSVVRLALLPAGLTLLAVSALVEIANLDIALYSRDNKVAYQVVGMAALLAWTILTVRNLRALARSAELTPFQQLTFETIDVIRRISATYAIAGTLAYLLVSIFIWPSRAKMEDVETRIASKGELTVWLERIDAKEFD